MKRAPQILAILQARTSSTRLPGKVLMPLMGRPMLVRQIERLKHAQTIAKLIVATSRRPEDDAIAAVCGEIGIDCFRGRLNDVLDRYYQAALQYEARHVMRLTGDCPLIDPAIVDAVARLYFTSGCDYVSNCRPPTLPDGLDTEVFSFEALYTAWQESTDPFEREHVVPFIIRHPERFSKANFRFARDYSYMRWTVDEADDFEFVQGVYEALYARKPLFDLTDVIRLLEANPEMAAVNSRHKRNAGSRMADTIIAYKEL